ncbi:hypothetical protein B0O99DRAFT_597730 [Bisporella sp. PMI_857]|nr:hypothetical protein B0O99DRAFT_597730 [Bisporella sp. PMI_857]
MDGEICIVCGIGRILQRSMRELSKTAEAQFHAFRHWKRIPLTPNTFSSVGVRTNAPLNTMMLARASGVSKLQKEKASGSDCKPSSGLPPSKRKQMSNYTVLEWENRSSQ